MAATGAQRHQLEGCLCNHTATHVSRPLRPAQLALPLQGDGRCLRRCISVHATGTVLSRDQKQSTAIATEPDIFKSIMETTIRGVEKDVNDDGNGSSKQKAVWLAYLNRMQQRKGLQQGNTSLGNSAGKTVSDIETNDRKGYMRAVNMPQNQQLQQVRKATSHTHDGNDGEIAHASAEDQCTANLKSSVHDNSSSTSQQPVDSTGGRRATSQKQGSKKTSRKPVTQPLNSGIETGSPLSTVNGYSEPDAAKQVTLPLLKDDEMASEGAWLNPVYRTIRKAQLLHVKQAAGAQLVQHSQPGSSGATSQPAGEHGDTNRAGSSNVTDNTGSAQRMGSVTDCLTLSEDRSRLNPVIRLIRKKELQMARRGGSSQAAGVPATPHEQEDGGIDIDNTDRSDSSTTGQAITQTSGTEAADSDFRIIPEHQIASESARMNPVYRMIRKMELTKKLKRTDDSVSAATAAVDMTYSNRPSGLASLLSLSDSLLTLAELDPSHSLALSLDPGSLPEEVQDGYLPGGAAGTGTASTQRGSAATGLLTNRGRREVSSSRAASPAAGTPARHAYLAGMTSRQTSQSASRWGHGNDHSIGHKQQQHQQQQQDDPHSHDDDWQPAPFPSTGHTAVDRTIRIRQLSLSQRKKQQQAAMAQGLPIPYQQQKYFSRQQRRAQHMQPQKWFDDSLMHVSSLILDETVPSSPAIIDKQPAVSVYASTTQHSQQAVGAAPDARGGNKMTQLAVGNHMHAAPAAVDAGAEAHVDAEQQPAADVWKADPAAPMVPGLPPGLRRRAATNCKDAAYTRLQVASKKLNSHGLEGSILKNSRQHGINPTAERVEAAAAQLAGLLGLDAEWRHYERLGLWERAKQHRYRMLALTTKLISRQPSLAYRKLEVLEANFLFLCKALGVPRARGVEAVCRQPAVLELAPATVWQRYQHLLTLAKQHCGGRMRPLDVSNAVIQSPVIVLLTPSLLKKKLLALSRLSAACTDSMTAVTSHTEPLASSQGYHPSSPDSSSSPHATPLQPHEQCGTVQGAESDTGPEPPDMITSQAANMLLSDPMMCRYSASKIKMKAELLFNAAAKHPAWQQQLQKMSETYLARCLKVSEQVLLRLQYLAEHFNTQPSDVACDTVNATTDQEREHVTSILEPDSGLQMAEQASSGTGVSVRPRGRPRKPAKMRKPVGRPVSSTLPCIGYILLTRSRDFEARYPGFAEWVTGRSAGLKLKG